MVFRENGYFLLNKQNNTVNLTLGRNYLLPERELTFDYKDLIVLSELIKTEDELLLMRRADIGA